MLFRHGTIGELLMNQDNQRLKDIQALKKGYESKMLEAPTMTEAFEYQDKWKELDSEEKEILKRFDVII